MALIDTLGTGVSALQSFTTGLDTVANDIANINTTAFKGSSTSFADTFSGAGVQVAATNQNFVQGSLSTTGVSTNLGISGNGFFIVQNAAGTTQFATRDGGFTINSSGYLVNSQGYEVMGLTGGSGSSAPSTVGPIRLNQSPPSALQSVSISSNGNVVESYADGSEATTNQVLLQNFVNPDLLVSQGGNLYSNLSGAAPVSGSLTLSSTSNTPGGSGLGTVESGTLEQSNVDLTQEFASMITMQRAFEANSRLVTVSDTILQDIINLKQP
jgi:flagellar hook protein FlgE